MNPNLTWQWGRCCLSSCFLSAAAKQVTQLNITSYIWYLCMFWNNIQIHFSTDVAMAMLQSKGFKNGLSKKLSVFTWKRELACINYHPTNCCLASSSNCWDIVLQSLLLFDKTLKVQQYDVSVRSAYISECYLTCRLVVLSYYCEKFHYDLTIYNGITQRRPIDPSKATCVSVILWRIRQQIQ